MTTSELPPQMAEMLARARARASGAVRGDAARPALLALAVYAAASAVAIVVGGLATRAPALAVAHAIALALVLALAVQRGTPPPAVATLRAWLPLLALPLAYAELAPLVAALHQGMRDAVVLGWERALFGEPARTLAARFPSPALSELLHAGYLSYYPLIFAPPLLLALRRRRRALGETVFALTLAYAACFLVFLAFPVEGPRFRFGAAPDAPSGWFRDLARALLAGGSSRGSAFPSSHVAVSTAQAVLALRHQPLVGAVAMLCTVLIAAGAVYGGFHYATDVVAGAALGLAAAALAIAAHARLAR